MLLLGPYTISVLYQAHICMTCSLGISNFLEEISSLSHSVLFLYLAHIKRTINYSNIMMAIVPYFPSLENRKLENV